MGLDSRRVKASGYHPGIAGSIPHCGTRNIFCKYTSTLIPRRVQIEHSLFRTCLWKKEAKKERRGRPLYSQRRPPLFIWDDPFSYWVVGMMMRRPHLVVASDDGADDVWTIETLLQRLLYCIVSNKDVCALLQVLADEDRWEAMSSGLTGLKRLHIVLPFL